MKRIHKQLSFILIGALLMASASHFFLIPQELASGGVSGMAVIIHHAFPGVNIGLTVTLLNIILFAVGFIVLGSQFGALTLLGTFVYSALLILYERFIPMTSTLVNDVIVNVVAGSSIMAMGLAIVLNENASTGGTDIVGKIINKYFHLEIGKSIFLADSMVLVSATLVMGIEKGLYSIIGNIITSVLVDKFIAGFNTKIAVTIISDNLDSINDYINLELNRGTTIYKAVGGYTKDPRDILVTIVQRPQYIKIKEFVNEIDPDAFVFVKYVSEVIGEGFTRESIKW